MLLTFIYSHIYAYSVPQSKTMSEAVSEAKIIIVARLLDYKPDPEDKPRTAYNPISPMTFAEQNAIKPSGRYTFQVLKYLAGNGKPIIQLDYCPTYSLS